MATRKNRQTRRLTWLLFGLAALANAGCLAALAITAAGGAGAYVYFKGNVTGKFEATFDETWIATLGALGDLGMPVVQAEKAGGTIKSSTTEKETVAIDVEPAGFTPNGRIPLTKVQVRIGFWGDHKESERLLDQITARVQRLAPLPATAPPPNVTLAPPLAPVPAESSPPPLAGSK